MATSQMKSIQLMPSYNIIKKLGMKLNVLINTAAMHRTLWKCLGGEVSRFLLLINIVLLGSLSSPPHCQWSGYNQNERFVHKPMFRSCVLLYQAYKTNCESSPIKVIIIIIKNQSTLIDGNKH
ncbi:hypothetical protein GDO86_007111 [Hymenochirus boettgeri]|uniref:Uncharacterized protein n=1 Tax=Hymenochirus boettgeri TaxID=247094 RepID=A0A8T2ISH4_9PIPI|nr:hypothetical protein GDO86_007111 [Hymenochirus boettgeri]